MSYRDELNAAYASYYAERHALEDSNADPSIWELELWEKWESVFIEIHVRHHR